MKRVLKLVAGAGVAVGVAALLIWSFLANRAELAADAQSDLPVASASRVRQAANGETVVEFSSEFQQRLGIRTEELAAAARPAEAVAYGRLEEDPARSFVVRAPAAGNVREAAGQAWPEVGQNVADGSAVGSIEPRLAPTDRITLGDRLSSARGDAAVAQANLAAARTELARLRTLNADDKNVSDRAVQEAEARVTGAEAQAAAAARSVALLEGSLGSMRAAAIPLDAGRGGQVVEVMVHPGESVEAGQPVIRLARFDRLLARVDVPAGDTVAPGVAAALIVPLGYESQAIRSERAGLAAAIDPKTQGQAFLFRVPDPSFTLRPGLSVTAYLQLPGQARQGVMVPRVAVVHQSGQTWVYVQTGANEFARRRVNLEEPGADGWFTRSLAAGTRVATTGAQALLSEEFKAQIQVGEENPQ